MIGDEVIIGETEWVVEGRHGGRAMRHRVGQDEGATA